MELEITRLAEAALLERQSLPAEFGPDAVRPSYAGLGLANVAALATHWLAPSAAGQAAPPFDPALLGEAVVTRAWQEWLGQGPIRQVVLLLMDALGYDQLGEMMAEGVASNLAQATNRPQSFYLPVTSVAPSTTTTALTSAATAYAPASHAIMGTHVYFREIGSVVNLIGYRPRPAPTSAPYLDEQFDPDALVPVPNMYRRLEEAGVHCEIVNYAPFKGSSISRYTSVGSRAGSNGFQGYLTPADGFAALRERLLLNAARPEPSFTYAYVSNVDTAAHRYGPLHPRYQAEAATLDFALGHELFKPLAGRSDTVLLMVADHGQRIVQPDKVAWLNDHPDLSRMLMVPLTGEARLAYLHLKHGCEAAAVAYIQEHLAEHFLAVPTAQAVELGLFGPPGQPLGSECADRVGDLLLIARDEWICRQQTGSSTERSFGSVGIHGGLSRSEMLIPFLAYRF